MRWYLVVCLLGIDAVRLHHVDSVSTISRLQEGDLIQVEIPLDKNAAKNAGNTTAIISETASGSSSVGSGAHDAALVLKKLDKADLMALLQSKDAALSKDISTALTRDQTEKAIVVLNEMLESHLKEGEHSFLELENRGREFYAINEILDLEETEYVTNLQILEQSIQVAQATLQELPLQKSKLQKQFKSRRATCKKERRRLRRQKRSLKRELMNRRRSKMRKERQCKAMGAFIQISAVSTIGTSAVSTIGTSAVSTIGTSAVSTIGTSAVSTVGTNAALKSFLAINKENSDVQSKLADFGMDSYNKKKRCPKQIDNLDYLLGNAEDALGDTNQERKEIADACKEELASIRSQLEQMDVRFNAAKSAEMTAQNQIKNMEINLQWTKEEKERKKHDFDMHTTRLRRAVDTIKANIACIRDLREELAEVKIDDCELSAWSDDGMCDQECDEKADPFGTSANGGDNDLRAGTLIQTRTILQEGGTSGSASFSGLHCSAFSLERKLECNKKRCPINCKVSDWSPFSHCSADCDGGNMSRQRFMIQSAKNGGESCPTMEEVVECNLQPCSIDCVLSPTWSKPTECTRACGGGKQSQERKVIQAALGSGAACPEHFKEWECNTEECVEQPKMPSLSSMMGAMMGGFSGTMSRGPPKLPKLGDPPTFACGPTNLVVLSDLSGSTQKSEKQKKLVSKLLEGIKARVVDRDLLEKEEKKEMEGHALAPLGPGAMDLTKLLGKKKLEQMISLTSEFLVRQQVLVFGTKTKQVKKDLSDWEKQGLSTGSSTDLAAGLMQAKAFLEHLQEEREKKFEAEKESDNPDGLQKQQAADEKKSEEASAAGGGGAAVNEQDDDGDDNPALNAKNKIVVFTDGEIAYKRRVENALSKILNAGKSSVLFVGEDDQSVTKLRKGKWVSEDFIVDSDVTNILSGICPVKV